MDVGEVWGKDLFVLKKRLDTPVFLISLHG